MEQGISIGQGILWVLIWFGLMMFYTFLDVAVWRKLLPTYEKYLNVITVALSILVFLTLLSRKSGFQIVALSNASLPGVLLATGCAVMLYFLLDKGLDPLLEKLFPISEAS